MKKCFLLCSLIFCSYSFASAQDLTEMQKQLADLKQELARLSSELADTNRVLIPPGTIAAYMGKIDKDNRPPEGWLLCDGQTVLDQPEFADLKEVLGTELVPDLRGYFLRGLGGIDPDVKTRILGSKQPHAFASHNHGAATGSAGQHTHSGGGGLLKDARDFSDHGTPQLDTKTWETEPYAVKTFPIPNAGVHTHSISAAGTGTETRPANVAVNYIIKY